MYWQPRAFGSPEWPGGDAWPDMVAYLQAYLKEDPDDPVLIARAHGLK
jgi:glyoxylase-like metal-dependent hydrolase (beta-lactamase superfamily II)